MGERVNGLKESFDAIASQYDGYRRVIIPDFEGFYGAAVRAAALPGKAPSILDIGAGTGLLSVMLLGEYPAASVTLLDMSDRMLGVARERFGGRRGVRFVVADYRETDLGGPYDIIASALSIHHLEREEKRQLYGRIFSALRGGGVFVNADEVAGENDEAHRANLAAWDAFLRGGPLDAEEARAIMDRRDRFDRMEKLTVQLEWMKETGYCDIDVVYRGGCFSVFRGRKR